MTSSTLRLIHRRHFALCAAGVLMAATLPAQTQSAPDNVALAFTEVTSLLLGLSFTDAQRQRIRHFVDAYWQRQQMPEMKAVLGTVDFLTQMRQREASLREVALRMSRPTTLKNLAQEADAGDALAAWLLAQYYAVHPTLAPARPGGLPLTRDSVDGQLDLAHFMATEVHRQPAHRPTAAERERAYKAATSRHPSLSPEAQFALAQAPGEAARLRFGWARAKPLDRLIGRAELGGRLTTQEQAQVQQFMVGINAQLNGLAAQQQSMLDSSLATMRQNSETIMGRGTVWNPSTNRWEQQGGIVTEFNGTVRVP